MSLPVTDIIKQYSAKILISQPENPTNLFSSHIKEFLYQSKTAILEGSHSREQLMKAVGYSICAIRDINHQIKDLDESTSEQVIRFLRNLKPVALYWNQFPCQITSKSAFNKSFEWSCEFDWHRFFVHSNMITVDKVPLSDYITRNAIREQNLRLLNLAVPHASNLNSKIVEIKDVAILKCALEYGVYPAKEVCRLLENLADGHSSVQKLLDADKLYDDWKKMKEENKNSGMLILTHSQSSESIAKNNFIRQATNAVNKTIDAIDALDYGSEILNFKSSDYSQSMSIDVAILALVLYYDTEKTLGGNLNSDAPIRKIKNWLFDQLLLNRVQTMCEPEVKDIDDRINILMLMLTSMEGDLVMQSYRYLEAHADIADYHADFLGGVGDSGLANDHVHRLQSLVEDMLGQAFERSRLGEYNSYCKSGSTYVQMVIQCLIEIEFQLAARFKEVMIDPSEWIGLRTRQPMTMLTKEYKYTFVIGNGIYFLLTIAHSLLPMMEQGDETDPLVGIVMRLLCSICMENSLAIGHLFSEKEFTLLTTLLKVDRPYSCLALAAICKSNPNCFGERLCLADRIIDLCNESVPQLLAPTEDVSNSKPVQNGSNASQVSDESKQGAEGGYSEKEIKEMSINNVRYAFAWFNLLHSMLVSATDPPAKSALSIKIQRSIAQATRLMTVFNTSHAGRWDVDVRLAEDLGMPLFAIDDSLSVSTLMWMTAYMFVKTLNESLICCRSFIDRQDTFLRSALFIHNPDSKHDVLNSKQFDDIESGLVYFKEITTLYTRLIAIEIDNPNREFNKFIAYGNKDDLQLYFKETAKYAIDLIESLNEFKSYRFKQEYEAINKAFMLESLLPMCYKFMNAVIMFVDQSNYGLTGIDDLMSTIIDNRAILTRMIDRVGILKQEVTGMFVQTKVDINIADRKDYTVTDDSDEVTAQKIIKFKKSILKLYQGDHARYSPFVDMYKFMKPSTVGKDTRIPMFSYLHKSGNLLANSLKSRCESYMPRSEARITGDCRLLAQSTACNSQYNAEDVLDPESTSEPPVARPLPTTPKVRMDSYVRWRTDQLTQPNSRWYKLLDEGSEKEIDFYYETISDWFVCYTAKSMVSIPSMLQLDIPSCGSASQSALPTKKDDISDSSENSEQSDDSQSKTETTPSQREKLSRISMDTAADLFIGKPEVSSWLTVIDTLIRVKGESIRDVIYSRYLDCKTNKGKSEFDNLEIKLKKPNGETDDKERRLILDLQDKGSKVFECILRATLTVQMSIKNSVRISDFYMNFSQFFYLSSFIMSLADDNYKNFKIYIGKHDMHEKSQLLTAIMEQPIDNIDDDSKSAENSDLEDNESEEFDSEENSEDHRDIKKNLLDQQGQTSISSSGFLALYLRGLLLDNNELGASMIVSCRKPLFNQSEEVIIYNTVLLEVIKEFFTGPCQHNQQIYLSDVSMLLKPLYTVDQEIWDIRYLYQTAIVEYFLSLLEGNTDAQINIIGQRQPSEFYDLAVFYMHYLWINRKMAADRKLKPTKSDMLKWIDYPKSAMEIVSNQYQKETSFASHPAINIAIGLVHIINAVQTRKRQYRRFVSEKHTDTLELYGSVGIEIELSIVKKKEKRKDMDKEMALSQLKNKKLIFFHFVNIISCMIEVSIKNQKLCVPYQVMPKCFFLTHNTKKNFRMKCDISDPSRKLLALMDSTPIFIIEMDHYLKIYQKSPMLFWMSSNDTFTLLMRVTWWICLAMNVAAAYDWGYINRGAERIFVKPYNTDLLVYIGTMIIIAISSIVILLWTALMSPMAVKKTDERLTIQQRTNVKITKQEKDLQDQDKSKKKGKEIQLSITRYFLPWMELLTRELFFPSFFAVHLGLALLSLYHPIFLATHLFTITYISATSRYVLAAIYKPMLQLTFALVLILFIILTYSIIVARFFSAAFKPSESQGVTFCDNVRGCLLYVLDLGLRKGGGIGEVLEVFPFEEKRFMWKSILDISFFLLINVIMLNIFFSIIVGAFNDLRHDLQLREDDVMNTCFVCGFTRKDFEKQERPFDFHIQFEHDIWDYVNFLVYLADNMANDYSGNEYYLKDKYSRRSTEWLPIDGTIYLDESRKEAATSFKHRVEKEMDGYMRKILAKLVHINKDANDYFSNKSKQTNKNHKDSKVEGAEIIRKYEDILKDLQAQIACVDRKDAREEVNKNQLDLAYQLEMIGESCGVSEERQTAKNIVVKELTAIQQYVDSQISLIGTTYRRQKFKRMEALKKIDAKLDQLLSAK